MADSTIGQGTLTFAGLTSKFVSSSPINIDGKKIPAVNTTGDTDTSATYKGGNLPDYGQVKGTIFILAEDLDEMESLIGTEATLTFTSDKQTSSNTTAATITGTAIWLEAPMTSQDNESWQGAAVFQWKSKPTYTAESA